ncbi:LysR substrate-binding domain-containing protein [Desulfospira joergensenii]|uniref:LysR substrate-binding domain-containing protein n=1 Tax=Desulfospira joergensenii TaxID=53329 RepID=UPI0003B66C0A|nr:LysR substrate-binding domain-containing protein [Desulfospira joergensenii]
MQLSPDILRTFTAAARTLNFTQAARQLYLTQSAVSMQMNQLEKNLEKTLFRRIHRGVELTPDGENLLKYAVRLIRLHDEAVSALNQPEPDGLIRLGAAEDYASQHLPEILKRFRAEYPRVRVDLYCDLSENLLKMLEKKELDLCLCNSEKGEIEGEFLRHESVVWIGPKDSEPEKESPLPLALFHEGCMFRKWALQELAARGIPYRIACSSPSTAGVLAAVKSGSSIAPMGGSIPLAGFRILPQSLFGNLPSALVSLHRSGTSESMAQTCLARHITEEFRAMPLAAAHAK